MIPGPLSREQMDAHDWAMRGCPNEAPGAMTVLRAMPLRVTGAALLIGSVLAFLTVGTIFLVTP